MARSKKKRVTFTFDMDDPDQRALAESYPADRKKALIMRLVLLVLLLSTVLLGVFLPIGCMRKSNDTYSETPLKHTVSFSAFDMLTGFFTFRAFGSGYIKFLIDENDGAALFAQRAESEYDYTGPSDEQVRADVAYKRENTKDFGAYARYRGYMGYFVALNEGGNGILLEPADFLAEHLSYELEHLNWDGVNSFLRKVLAENHDDIAALASTYLLGSYDLSELSQSIEGAREQLSALAAAKRLPDMTDMYTGDLDRDEQNDRYILSNRQFTVYPDDMLVAQLADTLIGTLLMVYILLATLRIALKLFRQWKHGDSDIQPTHMTVFLFFVFVYAVTMGFAQGSIMQPVLSASTITVAVLAVVSMVYEVIASGSVRKFRKKYLPKE